MSRTPIERMVDEACGFDPNAPAPLPEPPRVPSEEDVLVFVATMDAAMRWHRRPSDPKRRKSLHEACKAARKAGWT